jgi:hypothetical protein
MANYAQSTAYTRMFLMVLSSDHVSPATGLTVVVTLSKAGGAFAAAGGTVTEVSSGWYKIALTTTDTNTLGDLAFHCAVATADNTDFVDQIGPLPSVQTGDSYAIVNSATYGNAALQVQIGNIAITGAPLNAVASSFTQTTGGVTSGTYASTATRDQVYHITHDTTGTIDEYYEFDLSPTATGNVAVGSSVEFDGYVTTAVNAVNVFAYNWGATAWEQIGTIPGMTSIVEQNYSYDLSTAHTGTGANLGIVRIRFQGTGLTSLALGVDRLLVGFANVLTAPNNFSSFSIDASGRIDVGKVLGTASQGAAGYMGVDWAAIDNPTSNQTLSGTYIQGSLSSASSAINTIPTSGSTVTTGTVVTGTYANAATVDGSYWEIGPTGGAIDMYFQFNVGTSGIPNSITHTGYFKGPASPALTAYAYNYVNSAWDQVGTVAGQGGTVNLVTKYSLTNQHVGTGSNVGIVRFRFAATGLGSVDLFTDQCLCAYVLATTGITNGSTITLASTAANQNFTGNNWSLVLGTQDVSSAYFSGATSVTGTATAAAGGPYFMRCQIGTSTLPSGTTSCLLVQCGFGGTITASTGSYVVDDGYDNNPSSTVPIFDFVIAGGPTNFDFKKWSGGIQINNMTASDNASIDGNGRLILDSSCTGGTVKLRGAWDIVDNSGGVVTITKTAAFNVANTVNGNLTQVNGTTIDARFQRALDSITELTVGSGSTTTSIVTSSMSPSAAVTGQFVGLVLAFDRNTTTANLRGQKTVITASTSGGVLTVNQLTTAPVSGDTATIS